MASTNKYLDKKGTESLIWDLVILGYPAPRSAMQVSGPSAVQCGTQTLTQESARSGHNILLSGTLPPAPHSW